MRDFKFIKRTSSIKGLTLIELIINIAILSALLVILNNMFYMNANYWTNYNQVQEIKRNINITKVFIEKRIKECNQADITYDHKNKIIKGRSREGNIIQINLSGRMVYDYNTLIYFYRDNKEVRINKKGEHNVLAKYIDNITVKEVIPGRLLEIEIFSDSIDYSVKMNLRIN